MSVPRSLLSNRVHGLSVQERTDNGRAARTRVPRSQLGDYQPSAERQDPVDLLVEQEKDRVAALLPLRHQRMSANPFAFYRGAAAIMAADLGTRPHTGLYVQLCGDAHLSNLGIFAGQDRSLVFDINDFDETAPGPFEWDVFRLATSFQIAATEAQHSTEFARSLPGIVASSYRDAMSMFASMTDLDVWYYRIDSEPMLKWAQRDNVSAATKRLRKTEAVARSRDRWSAVRKLTHLDGNTRRFNDQPPLLTSLGLGSDVLPVVDSMFSDYKDSLQVDRQELLHRYRVIDVGHKVVGVGSVGLLAFVILLQGRDDNDLLVIQVKEAVDSVLAKFTDLEVPTPSGKRVVVGQQLMQATSDPFLGWVSGPRGRSYYVRQLRDMKWSPDPLTMTREEYQGYAALCGTTLARAHARAGDPIAISSYIGQSKTFAGSVTSFADAYTSQNAQDFAAFEAAIAEGRISSGDDKVDFGLVVDEDGSVVAKVTS